MNNVTDRRYLLEKKEKDEAYYHVSIIRTLIIFNIFNKIRKPELKFNCKLNLPQLLIS